MKRGTGLIRLGMAQDCTSWVRTRQDLDFRVGDPGSRLSTPRVMDDLGKLMGG